MRILSIDSSLGTQLAVVDAAPSAAGARALQVLSQDEQADTRRHAESLGQMLSQALSAPEAAERPLDAVVAATGPAPFTGLRAGLVTAGVVGRTRGIPVHGVSSLVATDARRREVYTALFRANGPDDVTRLTEIIVCPPAQVSQRLAEQAPGPGGGSGGIDVVAGSGTSLYPELAEMASYQKALAPVSGDALTQVRIALARLERGEELSTQPLYLRHADVQMPAARKRVR